MRSLLIIIFGLFCIAGYSQEKDVYIFYVELNHYSEAPVFKKSGDLYIYSGKSFEEKEFFSRYSILDFFQAYPDSRRERTLNMFMVVTYDKDLMNNMLTRFPLKYVNAHDVSNDKVENLATYPNDYGSTSPVTNLGVNESLKNFDYINVPKAWDYTYGDINILIGISDTGVNVNEPELAHKTTYLPGFNPGQYVINGSATHGTSVTLIAAAQGNNGSGTTGVCSDCGIVQANSAYGNPGTYENPTPDFNRLLQLAKAGVKVINMSWRFTFDTGHQWVIDEVYEDYGVVLVAGAGNEHNMNPNYFAYPASYNHVISVSAVNHKNEDFYAEMVDNRSKYMIDQIHSSVYLQPDGTVVPALQGYGDYDPDTCTYNDKVDICAPGGYIFRYSAYVLGENTFYNDIHTSPAAPHVSGTVGLMFSVNDCLLADEVEDILQLTAKNLEVINGNEPFIGRIGAGKLETGDAVEFTYEMKSDTGNALIDGQDFYRFDFNLAHINNKLTISNQTFRDKCTADFTAKNEIEVLTNTDLKPNADGYVDLKIDSAVQVCVGSGRPAGFAEKSSSTDKVSATNTKTKLYPNPNNGTFEISLAGDVIGSVSIEVYDLYGKRVFADKGKLGNFTVAIPDLATGMYIVKLSGNNYSETIKFIKQ